MFNPQQKESVDLKSWQLLVSEIFLYKCWKLRSIWWVFFRVAERLNLMDRESENWESTKQQGKNIMNRTVKIALNLYINFRYSSMNQKSIKHQKDKAEGKMKVVYFTRTKTLIFIQIFWLPKMFFFSLLSPPLSW